MVINLTLKEFCEKEKKQYLLDEWDAKAKDLAGRFVKNFEKYTGNDAGRLL